MSKFPDENVQKTAGTTARGSVTEKVPQRFMAEKGAILLNDPQQAKAFFASKMNFLITPVKLNTFIQEQPDLFNIIDVRQAVDYSKGHLPQAINLPKDQWASLSGLKKDRMNIIYCYSLECPLAENAALEFAEKGYSVMELMGGFDAWLENHLNIDAKVHH